MLVIGALTVRACACVFPHWTVSCQWLLTKPRQGSAEPCDLWAGVYSYISYISLPAKGTRVQMVTYKEAIQMP